MFENAEPARRGLAPSGLSGCEVRCAGLGLESALRQFKKAVEKAGVGSDIRRHAHFEKPGDRRRRKSAVARKKAAGLHDAS